MNILFKSSKGVILLRVIVDLVLSTILYFKFVNKKII